jgi:hypothetical protein
MHPIPLADEIHFLVGAELTMIIVNPFDVQFSFAGASDIAGLRSEAAFSYADEIGCDTFGVSKGCNSQGPMRCHALLGQKISTVVVTPAGDQLILSFEGRRLLTIYSEVGGPYELGSITHHDMKEWIF